MTLGRSSQPPPVKTIHHGIHFDDQGEIQAFRASSKPIRLFCACVFYERKGLGVLIEAFERSYREFQDMELMIAGDGPEFTLIEQKVRRSPAMNAIRLLGRLPREDVQLEMGRSDLFILVGWDEPFATVYLEAMAQGLPIIACRDGGINDIVKSGVHGLMIEPRSVEAASLAILEMVRDPARMRVMGEACRSLIRDEVNEMKFAQRVISELRIIY